MVPVWVRQHRPKVHELEVPYPMIGLKQWASHLLATSPRFLLGGFSTSETASYTAVYSQFWSRYQGLEPDHPFYEHHPPAEWGRCIPFAIHGDEGRGKGKIPILITSYQMIVGVDGIETTNMSGCLGQVH